MSLGVPCLADRVGRIRTERKEGEDHTQKDT